MNESRQNTDQKSLRFAIRTVVCKRIRGERSWHEGMAETDQQ